MAVVFFKIPVKSLSFVVQHPNRTMLSPQELLWPPQPPLMPPLEISMPKDNAERTQDPALTLAWLLWHRPTGIFQGCWAFQKGLWGVKSDIRKYFFVENMVRDWKGLPMESPSLELFKSHVGCGTWGHGLEVALAVLVGLWSQRSFPS